MKKIALCIPLAVILAAVWAFAAGDAGDPLASLSYLNGEFTRTVEQKTDQALDDSDETLRTQLENGTAANLASSWQETRLKEGDSPMASPALTSCFWREADVWPTWKAQ